MRVFFGFRNPRLRHLMRCKVLPKCIFQFYLFKCNRLVRDSYIIFGKTYIYNLFPRPSVKPVKLVCTKCPGDFPRAVWAEIKKDNAVAIFDRGNWRTVFFDYGRHYKFIRLILSIRCIYSLYCTLCPYTFA